MDIFEKLEKLRRSHNYCEDSWYSCPKAEDGCANDSAGDDCDCGADNENKLLDEIINEYRNSLKPVERNDSAESKPVEPSAAAEAGTQHSKDKICSNIICDYCTKEHSDDCFHCFCGDSNGRFEGRKLRPC